MSDLTSPEEIQKAIEAKKKKLEELKRKKAERQATITAPLSAPVPTPTPPTPAPVVQPEPVPVVVEKKPSASDILSSIDSLIGPSSQIINSPQKSAPSVRAAVNLSVAVLPPIEIPAVETIKYEQGAQTDPPPLAAAGGAEDVASLRQRLEILEKEKEKLQECEQELFYLQQQLEEKKRQEMLQDSSSQKPLSSAEQQRILNSSEFQSFFARTSLIIERALSAEESGTIYDFTVDYTQDDLEDGARDSKDEVKLKKRFILSHKQTQNRPITSLSWSLRHKELLLCSYAGLEEDIAAQLGNELDGVAHIWNMHLPSRPEFTFSCQSAVLSAVWHPGHPRLVVGGTYNGQICIWDTRAGSAPVSRSSLAEGHTHPVYALQVVQLASGSYDIVSLSSDGVVCSWNDQSLQKPVNHVVLNNGNVSQHTHVVNTNVNSLCFDVIPGNQNNYILMLGGEEGNVYKYQVASKTPIETITSAHEAPITNLEFHPCQQMINNQKAPSQLNDLYLTSSFDWTVKLWNKNLSVPLFTFEGAHDYVYDVRWSPVHPGVFACGDGTGRLDLWNIVRDVENPLYTTHVRSSPSSGADDKGAFGGENAISKIRWSNDGQHIAVGTSSGNIHIYDVAPEFVVPGRDDANALLDKIKQKMKI